MAAPDPPTRATQALERLGRTIALGPPPLIAGEDGAAYDLLHGSVTAAVKPKDFLEEMWVRDIVDLSWDVLRLRRLKAQILTYCTAAQVRGYLKGLCGTSQAQKLSAELGDPSVVARVDEFLSVIGHTVESVTAEVFVATSEALERVDRMTMSAESRRNATLRDIERHRSSFARALRRTSEEVVEAEFEDVAPNRRAQKDAA
jgi:hypothetical protein